MSRFKSFPSITLYGQRITSLSFEQTIDAIASTFKKQQKLLLFAMNVHILLELHKQPQCKKQHDTADIIFPDGVPLLWLAKFQAKTLNGRVSGTDLCEKILTLESWSEVPARIFVVCSRKSVLEKLLRIYPNTVIDGYIPPFVDEWGQAITDEIIQGIKKARANVLLIGISPLKQEKWLWEHFSHLPDLRIGAGVGSALEILTGEASRAPKLFRDHGLEWLWRVLLEPRRLLGRYTKDAGRLFTLVLSREK